MHSIQTLGNIPVNIPVHHANKLPVGCHAQQVVNPIHGKPLHSIGHCTIQETESIPKTAVGRPGYGVYGLGLGLQVKGSNYIGQPGGNIPGGYPFEVITLAPGGNGGRKFIGLGGGQNKHHMIRRLFQGLEQGIKGTGGQHVYLVYDIHLIPSHGGGIFHVFPKFPYLVYPVIGSSVYFQYVHNGILAYVNANLAFIAGIGLLSVQTINGPGEYLGSAGLPRTPATGKQIGVGHTAR